MCSTYCRQFYLEKFGFFFCLESGNPIVIIINDNIVVMVIVCTVVRLDNGNEWILLARHVCCRGRLLVGTVLAFILHMFVTYSIENRAFNHVVLASSSSWLQEHVTDMSERCRVLVSAKKKTVKLNRRHDSIFFSGGKVPCANVSWWAPNSLKLPHFLHS